MKIINENVIKQIVAETLKNMILENQCDELMGYHASPAKFDQFDLNFLSTGEGSQQYGSGFYITANKETGEYYIPQVVYGHLYKDKTAPRKPVTDKEKLFKIIRACINAKRHTEQMPRNYPFDKTLGGIITMAQQFGINDNLVELLKTCKKPQDFLTVIDPLKKELVKDEENYLYTVDIPDGPYLNWDESNPETNMKIYQALDNAYHISDRVPADKKLFKNFGRMFELARGFKNASKATPEQNEFQKKLSKVIENMGYKGIEVAIGRQKGIGGDGIGYNYVIFNPNDIQIKQVVSVEL